MSCPQCGLRKAKRHCPALHQNICTVCCATKRLVVIDCPPDCVHLASARAHPPATARRQQEADVAALMPTINQLTERQYQLFFLFQNVIAQARPEGLARITDADVAEASGAAAATLETAARGVIYEQRPQSPAARKMAEAFAALVGQVREQGVTVYDREAAIALRAIERGAQAVGKQLDTGDTGYLDLMFRLLQVNRAKADADAKPASPIILT
jgi:hypothetical protein